jgi:hypothetical protein
LAEAHARPRHEAETVRRGVAPDCRAGHSGTGRRPGAPPRQTRRAAAFLRPPDRERAALPRSIWRD